MKKQVVSKILNSPLFLEGERDDWLKAVESFSDDQLEAFNDLVKTFEKRIEIINERYHAKKEELTDRHVKEWRKLIEDEKTKSMNALKKTSTAKDKASLDDIYKKLSGL